MTLLCVAIFVRDELHAKRDMALAAEAGADMVELRVDNRPEIDLVSAIVAGSTLPCIVTCRPTWEGGRCELPEDERLMTLTQLADQSPAYIDLELVAYREHSGMLREAVESAARGERPGLILSSHDFTGRPANLTSTFAELSESPADVAKIVWTARTVRDNLEAFELLRHRVKPTIALCMGEAGLISRILAK